MILSSLISAIPTEPPKYPWVNSATSGNSHDLGWIVDGLIYLVERMFLMASPVINWGSRIIIVSCVIIYFCSSDKKYISAGIKWGIIFTVYCTIRGAIK
ncbi:MAG TPA: hypothetical protein VN258_06395 [Mobilitalea sp.]|nr:hypothetical protein [Mobilitalea sp.]